MCFGKNSPVPDWSQYDLNPTTPTLNLHVHSPGLYLAISILADALEKLLPLMVYILYLPSLLYVLPFL